ncbi:DUF3558 domain-containing protein [Streptomyces sp. URMC 123]|uniref:DUF3558 domain-containing protein n=1 Tax=Streptomyces sp. URMC 123 TaxID=3423403 RepID=UPI003F1BAD18
MHRTAPRLARLLACAAVVPVILVAGCSSDSGKKDAGASATPSATTGSPSAPAPTATTAPARFAKLPAPCEALTKDTIGKLVPKAKDEKGTVGKSTDITLRGSCSWNGLDGFQYRWLDIALQRFPSDPTLGSGEKRAKDGYAKQVDQAKATQDAKDVKTTNPEGVGEEATTVAYSLTKDGDEYKQQTVVTRTGNVVVTINFNGAGFEDEDPPKAEDMIKNAEAAAKEAVTAVAEANKQTA